MPRPICPKCGQQQCSRRRREGFRQTVLYPLLGWYPWECGSCRKVFTVKVRGKSKRRPSAADLQAVADERMAGEARRSQAVSHDL